MPSEFVSGNMLFAYPNVKLLGYTLQEQLMDVGPAFLVSLVMAIGVSFIYLLDFEPIILMIIQVNLGMLVYFSLAKMFKLEALAYLIRMFKSYRMKDKVDN